MRQQIFDGKSWYPPSLLSLILFDTSIFLKHRRVLPRIFSVMWESFDGKSWCSLPPSLPVFSIKFCDTRTFLKQSFPLRSLSVLWENKFSTEIRDTRPLLLSQTFFDTRNFLKHRRVPPRIFAVLWDKFSMGEIVILPPSPLLPIKFCDGRSFLKHGRFPVRSFSVLWDNKVSTESCDTRPLLLSLLFFDAGIFLKHKGSSTIFFGTVRQFFDGRPWYSLPLPSYP